MPKVTVQIDPSACILAANCVGIEPKLFQIGQESYVELIDAGGDLQGTAYTFEASDADLEMIEEAIGSCPTRAISMQSSV
ncbi:MAG: ferredoxin [Acidobacteriota bacterium]|nr:ferredoxin [Acidobacteriota bacterium]